MYQDSELPKRIAAGQYTLRKRIGQGGMAVVYVADVDLATFDFAMVVAGHEAATGTVEERHAYRTAKYQSWKQKSREELIAICTQFKLPFPSGGKAAVKVMIPQQRDDAAIRFEAEWRQLLAINHPHLVKVYGGGREGELPWYSMEVVTDIVPLKEARSYPDQAKLDMVFQAAGGLQALHQRGIIHRDIKPANLLCSRDGDGVRVRVMDLGIAKLTTSSEGLTLSHHVMGTPYYMSPEQAGSSKNVDHRADIYSLGATLYSLICGARPYEGKSMYEVVGSLVRGEKPERPIDVRGDLDKTVSLLIERMMELDPDARIQTMEDVRAAIQAVFTGDQPKIKELLRPNERPRAHKAPSSSRGKRPSQEQAPPGRGRSGRRYQGHQRRELATGPLMIAGAAIILVLLVLIVMVLRGGDHKPAEGGNFTPGMGTMTTAGDSGGSAGSGSGSPASPGSGSGSSAAPAKTPLEQIRLAKSAIIGLIEGGRLTAASAQVDRLLDLAEENGLVEHPEFQSAREEIARARKAWLDALAAKALDAARKGDIAKATQLLVELRNVDSTHAKITEINDAIKGKGSGQGSERPVGARALPKEGEKTVVRDFDHVEGTFARFPTVGGNDVANDVEVSYRALTLERQGDNVVVRVRESGAYIKIPIQIQTSVKLRISLPMKVDAGPLHVHKLFFPQGQPDHDVLDAHNGIGAPLAQAMVRHTWWGEVAVFKPGVFVVGLVFKDTRTYTLGRMRLYGVYHDANPPDLARIAELRKRFEFDTALDVLDRSAQTERNPELKQMHFRLELLAMFARDVRGMAELAGKSTDLAALPVADAIALHHQLHPRAVAGRHLVEAAFLWERRDPGALAAAKAARDAGAGNAAVTLINDIEAAGRQGN